MKKLILGSLATVLSLAAMLPATADTVETTQVTNAAPVRVVDSWMEPAVSRTRTVTTSDGTSTSVVEPLVMERHERVVVPTTQTTTTTTVGGGPRVTTEEYRTTETKTAPVKRVAMRKKSCVSYRPRHHYVAHRSSTRRAIAYRQPTSRTEVVRRTTVEEPQVIQQNQHVEERSVIIDRRDPALDLY